MTQLRESTKRHGSHFFWPVLILLLAILALFFWRSFSPDYVLSSNDGPLGGLVSELNRMPDALHGVWGDLNSIGYAAVSAPPSFSSALRLVTTPLLFSKIYCPFSLLVLGLCAWFCFRRLRLSSLACVLGMLATVLNAAFFSNSCWGVASQSIMAGMMFLALGLLARNEGEPHRWLKTIVAGFAVGMGVMEGFDLGALLSILIAAFVFFQSLNAPGRFAPKAGRGVLRVAVVALFALFMAWQALNTLVSTQITGVGGTQQSTQTRQERWDWATQWSMPKRETLSLIVPGLFGYRMDTPKDMAMFGDSFEGGAYWGAIGRDPAWDRYIAGGRQGPEPEGSLRFSGGGAYCGVLVALVAFWTILQSFRKQNSIYDPAERRFIWFWAGAMLISLLLAWGRFAPFYWLLYQLPYFSTIRNPVKFMFVLDFSVVILFAYGINGLSRRYLRPAPGNPTAAYSGFSSWWAKATSFDRRWVAGCALAVVASGLGWIFYANSRQSLVQYLTGLGFDSSKGQPAPQPIAAYSIDQVGWFILFLVLGAGLLALVLSGRFAGARARTAGILFGILLVVDVGRADLPWVIYWNYKQKYQSNEVIDFLREKPYEQRVAIVPEWLSRVFQVPDQFRGLQQYVEQLYRIEWAQHHFQYFNIQSLDIVQMPRMPEDLMAYRAALTFIGSRETLHLPTREWELTSTRYLIGPTAYVDLLNQGLDPTNRRFRVVETFEITPKQGVVRPTKLEELTAVTTTNGRFAVFEFTGALPRAKLYANWHVSTNDPAILEKWVAETRQRLPRDIGNALASRGTNDLATLYEMTRPEFNPQTAVLLSTPLPPGISARSTNENAGTVEYASYAPKRIVLRAQATLPSVLLLNDKYDPNWQVTVDGKRAELLRCNYIMRGVSLSPGTHTVEFAFKPPIEPLYVSLAAIVVALSLVGYLVVSERRAVKATPGPDKPDLARPQKPH